MNHRKAAILGVTLVNELAGLLTCYLNRPAGLSPAVGDRTPSRTFVILEGVPSPRTMRLPFFLVIPCLFAPVECRPTLHDSEQLAQHPQGQHRPNMGTNADASAGPGRFYSVLNGSARQSIHTGFLGKSAYRHTSGIAYKDNPLIN